MRFALVREWLRKEVAQGLDRVLVALLREGEGSGASEEGSLVNWVGMRPAAGLVLGLLVAWVVALDLLPQARTVDMGVDLRGGNILMP